jgi:hypothetical protein
MTEDDNKETALVGFILDWVVPVMSIVASIALLVGFIYFMVFTKG